jgi:hypothetical protein
VIRICAELSLLEVKEDRVGGSNAEKGEAVPHRIMAGTLIPRAHLDEGETSVIRI